MSDQILPFQSRFVTVAGYKMHYLDEGNGPVVLLLHGNPTWSFFYRNVIRELKDSFRLIAPDFLGMGLSDRTPGVHFRAIDRINQLDEFVSILGLESFSMVMHDWGGPLGTGFLLRRLPSIQRIVYLNTTLTETESLPPFIKLAATPVIGKTLTRHTASFLRMMTSWGVCKKLTPDVVDGYMLPYSTRAHRDAIWDFVADIPFDERHPTFSQMVDIAAGLPKVAEKPVKIIWGLKDPCFHRKMLSKVAAHFPKAEILEIPEASHLVLDDAPQLAIPAIREFLSRSAEGMVVASASSAAVTRESGAVNAIYEGVMHWASETPTASAVVSPKWVRDPIQGSSLTYAHTTYAQLAKLVYQYQRGLNDLGLAPADRVLMLVSPGVDFLALSLAVMGRGATPVFLDPGIGLEKLMKCIRDTNPQAFIGSPRAHLLRFLNRSLFHRIKFHIYASEWAFSRGYSLGYLKRFANAPLEAVPLPILRSEAEDADALDDGDADKESVQVSARLRARDAALIAFTSGATGTPKGVIFTNEMVREQLRIIRDVLGQNAGARDLTLLPIFSLFNVGLGVTSVFPSMPVGRPLGFNPEEVATLVGDLALDSSFGAPTLWHKIADYAMRSGSTLPTMKRIFMAGAAVPRATLELVKRIAPNSVASTPYGSTEALPVTYISEEGLLAAAQNEPVRAVTGEAGTLVGAPIAGIDIRIITSSEGPRRTFAECQPLAVGEIGEVIVRGKNVSPEYLHRPDANKVGKILDGTTFWHRMGDVGYLDAQGNLYYCGRTSHSVYTAERAYHSVPLEEIFNTLPKVRRSALVSVRGGKEPAIVIEPLPQFWPEKASEREAFLAELTELAAGSPLTQGITQFFFHKSFPVDARHNAKIFRDQLGAWADRMMAGEKAA